MKTSNLTKWMVGAGGLGLAGWLVFVWGFAGVTRPATAGRLPGSGSRAIVHFEDPYLEQAVRARIGDQFGPISAGQLASITDLELKWGTYSLEGLQHCQSLKSLRLVPPEFTLKCGLALPLHLFDNLPSPVQTLRNRKRQPPGNAFYVTSLEPLRALTGLEVVQLQLAPGIDLSPLTSSPQLRVLQPNTRGPLDLAPLTQLTHLEELDLGMLQMAPAYPEAIAQLTQLKRLSAPVGGGSQGFESVMYHHTLVAGQPWIHDTRWLAGLTELEYLDLNGQRIGSLAGLAPLTKLHALGLAGNGLSDVLGLDQLAQLEEVNLVGNQVSEVSPLIGCLQLERIDLSKNPISDLTPLTGWGAPRPGGPMERTVFVDVAQTLTETERGAWRDRGIEMIWNQ